MKKTALTIAVLFFTLLGGWNMHAVAQTSDYSITIIQPKSSDVWVSGTSHLISWTDNLTKPVNIFVDLGSGYTQINQNDVYGSTWKWNIPVDEVTTSTTAKIKVASVVDGTIKDESEEFTIEPSWYGKEIQIQQPNDASNTIQWAVNTKHLISWSTNFAGPEDVYLVDKNTPHVFTGEIEIKTSKWGNSYIWTIPEEVVDGNGNQVSLAGGSYAIKIYKTGDHNVEKEGAPFEIVAKPVGSEIKIIQPNDATNTIKWAQKTTHLISWTNSLGGPVDIVFSKRESLGQNYSDVLTLNNVYGSTKSWYIDPNVTPPGTYKITIKDHKNQALTTTSAPFEITKSSPDAFIEIEQPNDASNTIQWAVNTKHLISWSKNFSGTVDVYLVDKNTPHVFTGEIEIKTNKWGNSYTWTIPEEVDDGNGNQVPLAAGLYAIKIYKTGDHNVEKEGAPFEIVAKPVGSEIKIIQPNDATNTIKWAQKTTHLISWTTTSGGPVDIYIAKTVSSGSLTWTKLFPSHVYGSTKSWYIDDSYEGGYVIKIVDVKYPSLDAISAPFEITKSSPDAFIDIQQPDDASIEWAVNTKHLISWSKNFSGTVDIYLVGSNSNNTPVSMAVKTNKWGNSYLWTVPKELTAGGQTIQLAGGSYSIQIFKSDDQSISDQGATFKIVAFPVGSKITIEQPNDNTIKWAQGTSHLISWTNTLPGPVKIYIKNNDDTNPTYTLLFNNNVYGSTKTWYISNSRATGHYTMMIEDANYPGVYAESAEFQIIAQAKIDVYPNPSTTSVTVQFNENSNEHYMMTLYNRYNMRILQKPVNTSVTKQVRINTFNLPNGIYFLRFVSEKGIVSRKIVVQH